MQWRDGQTSWEEYSQDYLQSLSVFDSYVASVRLAARQGKTPPQRKKPAAAPAAAAAAGGDDTQSDDDDDEVAGNEVPPPPPLPPCAFPQPRPKTEDQS